MRPYYEAYDDRYRQVHGQGLQWFSDAPTPIVADVMERFGIHRSHRILELGCGEGRDAGPLLEQGFSVVATDISATVVDFCRKRWPGFAENFRTLDCIHGKLDGTFNFIYAVAVVHMLVQDGDRNGFYRFLRDHLSETGIGLVCAMGDGTREWASDPEEAFMLRPRMHQASGRELMLAGTSCRVVNRDTFCREMEDNGLAVVESGLTQAPPDFSRMLYAVVKKKS